MNLEIGQFRTVNNMSHHDPLKHLDEIKGEVGIRQYADWIHKARAELQEHPAFLEPSNARVAFLYERIVRYYRDEWIRK